MSLYDRDDIREAYKRKEQKYGRDMKLRKPHTPASDKDKKINLMDIIGIILIVVVYILFGGRFI